MWIKRLKIGARFVALLCYFAPFETCNFPGSTETTSPQLSDSITSVDQRLADSTKVVDVPPNNAMVNPAAAGSNSNARVEEENVWDRIYPAILFPTNDSISGIGTIFYFDNLVGRIAMGVSFFLSLFLLFSWKFLRIKNRRQYWLLANLVCILVFIADGLVTKSVELRWGVWCLTCVVIFQLLLENYHHSKTGIEIKS